MQPWCWELCKREKPTEEYIDENNRGCLAIGGSLHSSVCFYFCHQSLLELSVLYPHDSVFCMRETLGIKASAHGLCLPKQKFGFAGM